MPTGNLLRQETVTRKTRPQLSELNSNDLRPMFTTPVARSQIVLDSSESEYKIHKCSLGGGVVLRSHAGLFAYGTVVVPFRPGPGASSGRGLG